MKRALVIAYYFPPFGTVGSLRPLGFCRFLHKYGWMPTVVSTDSVSVHPPCPIDESLVHSLPDHVVIHRVPYTNKIQSLLRLRERLRRPLRTTAQDSLPCQGAVNGNSSKRRISESMAAFVRIKRFFLDWAFDFPDPQSPWLKAVMRQAASFTPEQKPDLIFATGGPWTGLLIGQALAKYFQVPFVADFRDPWITDSVYQFSSPLLNRKAERMEAAVCSSAAAVIANTDELRMEFLGKYSALTRKFVTITNGFNFPAVALQSSQDSKDVFHQSETIEICHFGSVYGDRNASSLFQAISEIHRESCWPFSRIRLRFVGSWEIQDAVTLALAKQLEENGLLRREPPVSHRECMQQMASAQALLILQPHSASRVPAKTYEYIASGRPIILIGEKGAASHLIEQHRLGKWCPNSVAAIKALLTDIAAGVTKINPPAKDDIRQFEYSVLTKQLAEVFDNVVSRKPAGGNDSVGS